MGRALAKPIVLLRLLMRDGFRFALPILRQLPRNDGVNQPAFLCRAADLCAFFAARRPPVTRRPCGFADVFPPRPFKLCFSASIRLTTLLGFSSRSGSSIVLPLALRFTS